MKRLLAAIIASITLLTLARAQDFNVFTDVNLVLSTQRGMIGSQYLTEFVEEEETKRGETPQQALERIERELFMSLRKGLNEKSKTYHFGNYPESKYEMKVQFVKCNSDGQRGKFIFTLLNKENGKSVTFDKSCRGGTFGTRLHLLNESIEGAGRKAASHISHQKKLKKLDIE